ncbi:MAG: glycine zipper 2TM domain-containing protein [Gammaproteobacteria bacterium]|nr:glycine zipper 2TM domain-containing protein [Gammaproteobacteria bacterium]
MNTKFAKILALVVSGALFTSPAWAGHEMPEYTSGSQSQTRYVYADVTHVEPIKRYVTVSTPERVCEDVAYRHRQDQRHQTAEGTIAGGLIGGLIGRQFGGGKGRDAATVAGVLIGSAIGHDKEADKRSRDRDYDNEVYTREECHTRYSKQREERIEGYTVSYLFQGEEYVTRTRYAPGDKIRIALSIRPAPENDSDYSEQGADRYRGSRDDDQDYGEYAEYDYDD